MADPVHTIETLNALATRLRDHSAGIRNPAAQKKLRGRRCAHVMKRLLLSAVFLHVVNFTTSAADLSKAQPAPTPARPTLAAHSRGHAGAGLTGDALRRALPPAGRAACSRAQTSLH
jgi:hypothetical protein